MSQREPNADDDSIDPRPFGGAVSGHAAVGFVTGQRWPNGQKPGDGSAPEAVRIVYRRGGDLRSEVVQRESVGQQVEDTDSDSVRFWIANGPHSHMIRTDEVLTAEPVEVEP
jgi:hypothetical protein